MIGLFLMNFVSDIKGRKYALTIALGLSIVGITCTKYFKLSYNNRRIFSDCHIFGYWGIIEWLWRICFLYHLLYHTGIVLRKFFKTKSHNLPEHRIFFRAYHPRCFLQLDSIMVQYYYTIHPYPLVWNVCSC